MQRTSDRSSTERQKSLVTFRELSKGLGGGGGGGEAGRYHGKGKRKVEKKSYINVLELKAAKLAIMTFTITSIHVRMDNILVLSYLMKMVCRKNQELVTIRLLLAPQDNKCR